MRKELGTENGLVIGCMAVILRSIFIDDKKGEFTKAQLQFTRDIVRYEQKFLSAPEAKERVLRRPSLGILLYQFNIYKHHETKQSRAAHEYLTRDIMGRRKGSVAVPKEQVKQEIWEMYDPDFTGIDLSSPQFAGATIPLDLSVRIKKSADYTDDYFSNESYQANCGKGIGSPKTFLARMNELIDLPNYLADIWRFTSDRSVLADSDEGANELGITAQEYKQFDIFKVLPDMESLISKFAKEQSEYLVEYLSRFDGISGIVEIVQRLKNICHRIPVCSPVNNSALKELIEWEFQRMQITTALSKDFSGPVGGKLRLYCFQTLLPKETQEIKSPTKEDLEKIWGNKEIVAKIPEKMFGKILPKSAGELYFPLSTPKRKNLGHRLVDQMINLEKELKEIKEEGDEESVPEKEGQITKIQQILVDQLVKEKSISPEQLESEKQKILLLLKQDSYARRLAAGVSLPSMQTYVEKQYAAAQENLAALSAKEGVHDMPGDGPELPQAVNQSPVTATSGPSLSSVRRASVLNRWQHVESRGPEEKQFGNTGKLEKGRLTPFNRLLLLPKKTEDVAPARPVLPLAQPQPQPQQVGVLGAPPAIPQPPAAQQNPKTYVLLPVPADKKLRPVRKGPVIPSEQGVPKTEVQNPGSQSKTSAPSTPVPMSLPLTENQLR